MKRKSPQEKKRLSLAKDRRDAYGGYNKTSRTAIPLRKAIESRRFRRALKADLINPDEPARAPRVQKAGWRKLPDSPLEEVITIKRDKRVALTNRKSARRRDA